MKQLFLLLVLTGSNIANAIDNWPSFLGAGKSSVLSQSSGLPTEWSATSNVAWQVPLPGYGQSSPVVWDGKVYLTCIDGPMKELFRIVCLDLATGKTLWVHEGTTENLISNDDYHSRASMTAVVDAVGVVAGFESGTVVALDHTGKVRWSTDLFKKFGSTETNHGISSSLAQDDSQVFVWVQRKENPYLIAFRKSDGAIVWKVDRPLGVSWGSPMMVPMPGGTQHIVLSSTGATAPVISTGTVCGLDPCNGSELWRVDGLAGNSSQTPVYVKPGQILVGASAGREGGPTKDAVASNGLIQIDRTEDKFVAGYKWRSLRATSGFCSPCYYKGYAYFTDRRGQVACLDIETGDEVYMERLQDSVWATPFGVSDRLYFAGEVGTTYVLRAGSKFEKLATNVLWKDEADAQYSPPPPREDSANGAAVSPIDKPKEIPKTKPRQYAVVAVDDTLLIRRGNILYAIRSN